MGIIKVNIPTIDDTQMSPQSQCHTSMDSADGHRSRSFSSDGAPAFGDANMYGPWQDLHAFNIDQSYVKHYREKRGRLCSP